MLISETYLIPNLSFYIPKYKIYRLGRNSGTKGGVAVVIKCTIQHKLTNSYNMWKFVKTIKNIYNSIPPLNIQNKTLLSPEEKCRAIKTQFELADKATDKSVSPIKKKVKLYR